HAPRHRAQHARHHEPGAPALLPGAWRDPRLGEPRGGTGGPARHRRLSGGALMAGEDATEKGPRRGISGYGLGTADTIISVEDVAREAAKLAEQAPSREAVAALAGGAPLLTVDDLVAGYGKAEIL